VKARAKLEVKISTALISESKHHVVTSPPVKNRQKSTSHRTDKLPKRYPTQFFVSPKIFMPHVEMSLGNFKTTSGRQTQFNKEFKPMCC